MTLELIPTTYQYVRVSQFCQQFCWHRREFYRRADPASRGGRHALTFFTYETYVIASGGQWGDRLTAQVAFLAVFGSRNAQAAVPAAAKRRRGPPTAGDRGTLGERCAGQGGRWPPGGSVCHEGAREERCPPRPAVVRMLRPTRDELRCWEGILRASTGSGLRCRGPVRERSLVALLRPNHRGWRAGKDRHR